MLACSDLNDGDDALESVVTELAGYRRFPEERELVAKKEAGAQLNARGFRLTQDEYDALCEILQMKDADGQTLCKMAIGLLIETRN